MNLTKRFLCGDLLCDAQQYLMIYEEIYIQFTSVIEIYLE